MKHSNFTGGDNPNNFKYKTKEEMQRIGRLGGVATGEAKKKRKEYKIIMDVIGQSTVPIEGYEVSRDFLVIYKLYELALGGNLTAIKMLIDLETKNNLTNDFFANIIKLKIE